MVARASFRTSPGLVSVRRSPLSHPARHESVFADSVVAGNPKPERTVMKAKRPERSGPAKWILACLALGLAAAQAAPLQLHVDGNKVKDSNGNIVRLQGANIPSLEWKNTGDNIVASQNHLRDVWKANFIRFPLSQDRWFGHAPGQSDGGAAYRAIVDGIVSRANAGNYYVLLDLHWSNRGTWGSNIGQAAMPDMNSATFWTDCATRYKNNPSVLFDLYNEPYL